MPEEENVGKGYQNDLFDKGVFQRIDSVVDESTAIVEGNEFDYPLAGRARSLFIFCFTALITSSALVPYRVTTTPPTASLPSLSSTPRRNSGPNCTLATLRT